MTGTAAAPRRSDHEARGPRRGPPPDGPIILVRPVRSSRPGTMPAGLVLLVVVVALFVAMLLNAPATLRKSRGKTDNAAWRTTVAESVDAVSGFFFLDVPRNRLDEALGKNLSTDDDIDVVVAEAEANEPAPTTESLTPTLAVPTAEAPLTLYVGGDSMANGLASSLVRGAESTGLVDVIDGGIVSSGLSRPDFLNWPQKLSREVDPQNALDPDIVVLLFGANDLQNIPIEGGGYEVGSAAWLGEYRRRVAGVMDIMSTPGNDRIVLWVGIPVMGPRSGIDNAIVDQVNQIYWEESQSRPWVEYVDSWSYFVGTDGGFAEELVFADGESRRVRASDDIHMQVAGYDRMGWAVMAHLLQWADLSASPPEQPPSQMAPPEVVERAQPGT